MSWHSNISDFVSSGCASFPIVLLVSPCYMFCTAMCFLLVLCARCWLLFPALSLFVLLTVASFGLLAVWASLLGATVAWRVGSACGREAAEATDTSKRKHSRCTTRCTHTQPTTPHTADPSLHIPSHNWNNMFVSTSGVSGNFYDLLGVTPRVRPNQTYQSGQCVSTSRV